MVPDDVMFPKISAMISAVLIVSTPDSPRPLPKKKGAMTFPVMFTCPLAAMLPPDILTFPTFPVLAMMFATLA